MLGKRRAIKIFPAKNSEKMWLFNSRSPVAPIIFTRVSLKNQDKLRDYEKTTRLLEAGNDKEIKSSVK